MSKEMTVNEAIEFVNSVVNGIGKIAFWSCEEQMKPIKKDADNVITLLKRGEAMEKILDDIKNIFRARKSRNGGQWTGNNLLLNIYDIEQKYLKEAK